jgi:hypothetical protein
MDATGDIIVQYDPWGRMGNRMFQYAFGYILSILKNKPLYHGDLPNFGIVSNLKTEQLYDTINTKTYGNNHIDMNFLLSTEKTIVVDSYLQRAEYYTPYRDILKQIFRCQNLEPINKDKLVLHIRETDYIQLNAFIGYNGYKKIIEAAGYADVIIVTDNSNCEAVQRLLADGCVLNSSGYVDKFTFECDARGINDFKTLLLSENIAVSQSSFSWWAAFLGDHKEIYFPLTQNGNLWKALPEKDDIDLFFELNKSYKIIL